MSGERIAILGAGAWGAALGLAAIRAGNETVLWARDAETVEAVNSRRENPRYLPGIALDEGLVATGDVLEALHDAAILVVATPAQTVREIAEGLDGLARAGTVVVCAAKGIDRETGLLPAETIGEALPGCPVAALSGPSFAHDVARGLPTAVTIGAHDVGLAQDLCQTFSSPSFRCYASGDIKGVELGGALKNVVALAVGAARGLELGASAEAALVARGFAEMGRIAAALGANPQTLMGLSGLGDLVLTCSGPQSRNFAYGMALARGEAGAHMKLAEGVFTAGIAASIAEEAGIDAPVTHALADVLDGLITAREAVARLMERPLKAE